MRIDPTSDLSPPTESDEATAHYLKSTLRERIVEHVFVGDALRRLWRRGVTDVEVLRSEFDAGGYDLVMAHGRIVRHVQLKCSVVGGRTPSVKVGLKLMEKPSGCVLWLVVTPDLELQNFLWFGGAPGAALPDIAGLKMVKHTKGDASGVKAFRPNHRIVPRTRFERLDSLDDVLIRLFGPLDPAADMSPP